MFYGYFSCCHIISPKGCVKSPSLGPESAWSMKVNVSRWRDRHNIVCILRLVKLSILYLNLKFGFLLFLKTLSLFVFFILLVLLRCTWHTTCYKFKLFSIMIWLASWNDCHNRFSEHPLSHMHMKINRKTSPLMVKTLRIYSFNSFHI